MALEGKSFKNFAIVALMGVFLAACSQNAGNKETIGTVLGAAAGAVVGAQFGKGTGRSVAVTVGTLAGAMIGNEIGRSLDENDRRMARNTTQTALENNRVNTASNWSNPDTGHSGTVTPTYTYNQAENQPCREYTTTVVIDGQVEEAVGRACRESDGTWRITN